MTLQIVICKGTSSQIVLTGKSYSDKKKLSLLERCPHLRVMAGQLSHYERDVIACISAFEIIVHVDSFLILSGSQNNIICYMHKIACNNEPMGVMVLNL